MNTTTTNNNLNFDIKDFNRLVALIIHLKEQSLQPIRNFFSKYGFNYDNGDYIVINANLFPELRFIKLEDHVYLSDYFPNNIPGYFIKKPNFNIKEM